MCAIDLLFIYNFRKTILQNEFVALFNIYKLAKNNYVCY
jgi:hypothetical protein